jgi:acetyltransferase-like isoleucine patch superfamily enzyme
MLKRLLTAIKFRGIFFTLREITARFAARVRGWLHHARFSGGPKKLVVEGQLRIIRDRGSTIHMGDNCVLSDRAKLVAVKFNNQSPPSQIKIGNRCQLKHHCLISVKSGLVIMGDRCAFGHHSEINCWQANVEIGSNVRIAAEVYIVTSNHAHDSPDVPIIEQGYEHQNVRIEDNVWIGRRAIILPGVTIGRSAIIGAAAVVTKDIPSNAIAVGVPARVVKMRLTQ